MTVVPPKHPAGKRSFIILHDPRAAHFQGVFAEDGYNPKEDFLTFRNEEKWIEWKTEQKKKDIAKREKYLAEQKAAQDKKDLQNRQKAVKEQMATSSKEKVSSLIICTILSSKRREVEQSRE